MIKATVTTQEGRTQLMIGLSFGNLDKFRELPGDTFIKINGREMGLPIDVVIFSGETEAHMQAILAPAIGPMTEVHA